VGAELLYRDIETGRQTDRHVEGKKAVLILILIYC